MKYFNISKRPKVKFDLKSLKSNEIILHHHLGMGDHITCNGLVNYLSEEFKTIHLPVKEKNYKTIDYLYQDNPKIKLLKLVNRDKTPDVLTPQDITNISNFETNQINSIANDMNLEILRVGHEKFTFPMPETFYTQLNLPYSVSREYFRFIYDREKNSILESHLKDYYNTGEDYVLVHSESSAGNFPVNSLKHLDDQKYILFEKKSDIFHNMFFYTDVLRNAKAIHTVNSSVFCLADRLETSEKLFFHNTNQVDNIGKQISFLKKWKIVNY